MSDLLARGQAFRNTLRIARRNRLPFILFGLLILVGVLGVYYLQRHNRERRVVDFLRDRDADAKILWAYNGPPILEPVLGRFGFAQSVDLVELDGDKFDDEDFEVMSRLPGLSSLYINGNSANDATLSRLGRLHSLSGLSIHSEKITDRGLSCLSNLKELSSLDLSFSKISGQGLKYLSHLPIEQLDLCGVSINDSLIPLILDFKRLTTLDVRATDLSAEGLKQLRAKMPRVLISEDIIIDNNKTNAEESRETDPMND